MKTVNVMKAKAKRQGTIVYRVLHLFKKPMDGNTIPYKIDAETGNLIQKQNINNKNRQTVCTCELRDHLKHHHLIQVQLLLSYTHAKGTPNILFDLQHCGKTIFKNN